MRRCLMIFLSLTAIVSVHSNERDSLLFDSVARLFRIDEIEVVARQEKDVMPPQKLQGAQLQALSTTTVLS